MPNKQSTKVFVLQCICSNGNEQLFMEAHATLSSAKKSVKDYLDDYLEGEVYCANHWEKFYGIIIYKAADFDFKISTLKILGAK